MLGPPLLSLFLSIEAAEVLPDDFIGPVTCNPFSPRIPTGDQSFAIHHENRVVFDAGDQGAKTLFAFFQGRLRFAALSLFLGFAQGSLYRRREIRQPVFQNIIGGAALEGL